MSEKVRERMRIRLALEKLRVRESPVKKQKIVNSSVIKIIFCMSHGLKIMIIFAVFLLPAFTDNKHAKVEQTDV